MLAVPPTLTRPSDPKRRDRLGAPIQGAVVHAVCFGGATVDRLYRASAPVRPGTSNPVERREAFGGVAHNVALNLALLGMPTALVSRVGRDPGGRALLRHLREAGIAADWVAVSPGLATAEYIAVLGPDRDLAFGMADMAILDEITLEHALEAWPPRATDIAFADCNLSAEVLRGLTRLARETGTRLVVDAVSVSKAERLPDDLAGLDLLFLNADEAAAATGAPRDPSGAMARLRTRGAAAVVLTLGGDGLLVSDGPTDGTYRLEAEPANPVDVTGAGDALIAATLYGLAKGDDLRGALRAGVLAAALTVEHLGSVRPDMSGDLLDARASRTATAVSA